MSDRDEIFAHEFLKDFNAKAAAIRAGYASTSARNAADWIHPDHPKKPLLRRRIDELIAVHSRRTGASVERVLVELGKIAFANPADLIDMGTGKIRTDAAREDAAAIASIKVKTGDDSTEHETKFVDKLRALELLGKYLGMFAEQVRLEGPLPVIMDDTEEKDGRKA